MSLSDLSRNGFDPITVQGWTKNRNLYKAKWKDCAAARGTKTHEPRRTWQKATYKCSKCNVEYTPKNFAYGKLAALEADRQLYRALDFRKYHKS